uniref:Uncharacterized protein n=1 Tax=Noctiluca scintillans TaxID=2966 RepID=A0A7S1A9Q8_NOCSC
MHRLTSLPHVVDTLLPNETAAVQKLALSAESRARRMGHAIEDLKAENDRDDADLRRMYELVDRLRVAAKDAQNYIDRAFDLSHSLVPQLLRNRSEVFAGRDLQLAHELHLLLGKAKDDIGSVGLSPSSGVPSSDRGAADLLSSVEQELGTVLRVHPADMTRVDVQSQGFPAFPESLLLMGSSRVAPVNGTLDCGPKLTIATFL